MKKNKLYHIPDHVTDIILESISDGVFTVDHEWHITSFNHAAEHITGIPRTMKEGKHFVDTSTYIVNSEKRRIPVVVSTSLLKDERGMVLGGVETFRDMSLVEELRKELDARYQVGDMVSRSPTMHRVFKIMPLVAESDSTVLIQGETGTGKEVLARALHEMSPRKRKPFVAINCGALPDTLLESELFGYKAGAFTDAARDKPGHFAFAEGGTILLDELGDLSAQFQVRLLRVLQDRTYQPLGGTRPIKADVRVIAATNKNLAALVKSGQFRQDLFYRINVVCLDLPPLRERKEDIPMLVKYFIERLNRLRGRAVKGISQEALSLLMYHYYPGNIRELENIIEHALVLCPAGQIGIHCLPENLQGLTPRRMPQRGMDAALKSTEAHVILDALRQNKYNRLATAHMLDIRKSTLYRKIKKLGIKLPDVDGRTTTKQPI